MNFTFTWILDRIGLQPKPIETPKPAVKKVVRKTVKKATTRTKK
jgi:hypothetical protein